MAQKLFFGAPVRVQMGGLPGGSGLALGPLVEWKTSNDITLNWGAVGSLRRSYGTRAGLTKNFTGSSLKIGAQGAYINGAKLDYYGPGPNSFEDAQTDFRREETSLNLQVRWQPPRQRFLAGVSVGPLWVNVGPGDSGSLPSTESVFSPEQAPGVDVQTDFIVTGAFLNLDYRDVPRNPRQGSFVAATYQHYDDTKLERFSFDQYFFEAEHYIPLLNKTRAVALRAASELSFHADDQVVPFYLRPTLGGPQNLRGFGRYRFYDNNSILFNAEYRWDVSTGFTMALFGDSGQVFNKAEEITWSNLRSDAGVGVRFGYRDRVVIRIDTAFSQEGFQAWLQVTDAF